MDDPMISALAATAEVVRTPTPHGAMVWRRWGQGAPLVLLHGGSGSWLHWLRNIEPLATDHSLWVADLPGFGDSDPPPRPPRFIDLVAMVVAGLRALGLGPVPVVGFSFGGATALAVATEAPELVRQVIVAGVSLTGEPVDHVPLRSIRDGAERDVHRHNLGVLMLAGPADDLAVEIQTRNVRQSRVNSRALRPFSLLPDWFDRLSRPLGVIVGEHDVIMQGRLAEQEQALRGLRPRAPFRVIAGAGHWVQYEAPAAFEAALRQMLNPAAASRY